MTLISQKYRLLVVTIPKTGTRSITPLLRDELGFIRNRVPNSQGWVKVNEHTTAKRLKRLMGKSFDDYKKITILRNPMDRLKSHYNFIQFRQKKPANGMFRQITGSSKRILTKLLPFYLWVMGYHYPTNKSFLVDENDELLIDDFGQFEKLETEIFRLLEKNGIETKGKSLGHRNQIKGKKDFYLNENLVFNRAFHEDMALYRRLITCG